MGTAAYRLAYAKAALDTRHAGVQDAPATAPATAPTAALPCATDRYGLTDAGLAALREGAGSATVADDTAPAPLPDTLAHLQLANLAVFTATPRTVERKVQEARALLVDFVLAYHVSVDAPMPDVGHDDWMVSCSVERGHILTAHAPDLPMALLALWRLVARVKAERGVA